MDKDAEEHLTPFNLSNRIVAGTSSPSPSKGQPVPFFDIGPFAVRSWLATTEKRRTLAAGLLPILAYLGKIDAKGT
jgi:hypothetical protein